MKITCIILLFFCSFILKSQDTVNRTDTNSFQNSIEYYNSILKRNKNSAFANFGLASIYFMKKDFDAAIKYCKKNIKEPNDYRADSYMLYGLALDSKGRVTEATGIFEEAQKAYPENYQISYQLSLNYYKIRSYEKGLNSIKSTIKSQPLYVPAHYLYGCLLFEGKNNPGSASAFLFGLLIDNDTVKTQQSIVFVDQFLQHKVENIKVPFFEPRFNITSIDDILAYYFPEQTIFEIYQNLKTEDLINRISDYITNTTNILPEYQEFFKSLIEEKQTEVFCHYVLRTIKNNSYLDSWFNLHRDKFNVFASFLNDHLPETPMLKK